jgi:hypothetical protein
MACVGSDNCCLEMICMRECVWRGMCVCVAVCGGVYVHDLTLPMCGRTQSVSF